MSLFCCIKEWRLKNILRLKVLRFIFVTMTLFSHPQTVWSQEMEFLFGVVPQFDARKINTIWAPVLKEVGQIAGVRLKLTGSANIPSFEKRFIRGDFDFAYMNPYHLIVAREKQGYLPLVKDNGRQLYGIIVVKKSSFISSIQELNGKRVAFPSPNALGASLLPRSAFLNLFKVKVEPVYVKSHTSVYLNVLTNQVEAGGGVQKTFNRQPEHIKNALKIIYKTPEVSPHPISVHPRVTKINWQKIQAAFLQLGSTPQGKILLSKIPIQQVGMATIDDYLPLESMGLDRLYQTK